MRAARCACGRVKSKHSHRCRHCHESFMADSIAKAKAIVATKQCPECGTQLLYNASMNGWWQCGNYGVYKLDTSKPTCHFQCFTERM